MFKLIAFCFGVGVLALLAGCETAEALKRDAAELGRQIDEQIYGKPSEPAKAPARVEPEPAKTSPPPVPTAQATPAKAAAPVKPAAPSKAAEQLKAVQVKPKPAWLCQPVRVGGIDWQCDTDKLVAKPSAKTRVFTRDAKLAIQVGDYHIEYKPGLPRLYRTVTR